MFTPNEIKKEVVHKHSDTSIVISAYRKGSINNRLKKTTSLISEHMADNLLPCSICINMLRNG